MQVGIQNPQNRPTGAPNIPQRPTGTPQRNAQPTPASQRDAIFVAPRGMYDVTTRPSGTVYLYCPAQCEIFASHNQIPNIPAGTPNIPTCPTGLPYICSTNPTIRPIKTLSSQQIRYPTYHTVLAGRHLGNNGIKNVTTRPSGTVYW